jgi:hypothetical protein
LPIGGHEALKIAKINPQRLTVARELGMQKKVMKTWQLPNVHHCKKQLGTPSGY